MEIIDVAVAEELQHWDSWCYDLYTGTDGWRCQICQDWIPGTDSMVEHLFLQHGLAPVFTGVASMWIENKRR